MAAIKLSFLSREVTAEILKDVGMVDEENGRLIIHVIIGKRMSKHC